MERKTNSRLFLDIHAIQTVPPSNINRDDTGSPKTAQYGGVTRARVSSQSWKRAMRMQFPHEMKGIRTKRFVELCKKNIDPSIKIDEESFEKDMTFIMDAAGFSVSDNKGETLIKALFTYSTKQIGTFLRYYFENKDEISKLTTKYFEEKEGEKSKSKKTLFTKDEEKFKSNIKDKVMEALKQENSLDIILFGRMFAGDKSLSVDACSQVAHAISTHAIESEFDFYTAVDDLAPEDNQGAGMLGTIEYNSSTLYRYANIALHEFMNKTGEKDATVEAAKLFVEAFINSMPTGKINSFANQTLPQAVVVTLRKDRPVNMVSAFEKPIKSNDGYVEKSVKRLFEEYPKYDGMLEEPLFTAYYTFGDYGVQEIGQNEKSTEELINDLGEEINQYLDKIELE